MAANLEKNFNPRALKRRKAKRTFSGLFDERDFPLVEDYILGVIETGAQVKIKSRWLNSLTISATRKQIETISAFPYVKKVGNCHIRKPHGRFSDSPENPQEINKIRPEKASNFNGRSEIQLELLGLDLLHKKGFTGKDVIIAVIDCGFNLEHKVFNHPDHPLRVAAQWDFVDNDPRVAPESTDPPTQHYHGSYVLGLVAAFNPKELIGSAYDATYILCKAEDAAEEYLLEEFWFVAALEFAESQGADVITSSLGLYTGYTQDQLDGKTCVMTKGWNIAAGNGIIGLQGIGNSGHDMAPDTSHIFPPGDSKGVISCGAVLPSGQIAPFSSDGPTADGRIKPELLAPGDEVWTISASYNQGYKRGSGTSMATPLLAGAVACLLQARPDWSVSQIRQALFRSGDYFRLHRKPDPLFIHGFGIPNMLIASGLDDDH